MTVYFQLIDWVEKFILISAYSLAPLILLTISQSGTQTFSMCDNSEKKTTSYHAYEN